MFPRSLLKNFLDLQVHILLMQCICPSNVLCRPEVVKQRGRIPEVDTPSS